MHENIRYNAMIHHATGLTIYQSGSSVVDVHHSFTRELQGDHCFSTQANEAVHYFFFCGYLGKLGATNYHHV